MTLENKIDFAIIIDANGCNPNGDPGAENQPRTMNDGLGFITDVCIKRKLRDRLAETGQSILIKNQIGTSSIEAKLKDPNTQTGPLFIGNFDENEIVKSACREYFDVRAFGQLIALPKKGGVKACSIGIKGPVTLQMAKTIDTLETESINITKSMNGIESDKKGSDTMGMKYVVSNATYVSYGGINALQAERTGFTKEDADILKGQMLRMFDNDESSARPSGSMAVKCLVWWKHESKTGNASSAKVHNTLRDILSQNPAISVEDLRVKLSEVCPSEVSVEVIEGY